MSGVPVFCQDNYRRSHQLPTISSRQRLVFSYSFLIFLDFFRASSSCLEQNQHQNGTIFYRFGVFTCSHLAKLGGCGEASMQSQTKRYTKYGRWRVDRSYTHTHVVLISAGRPKISTTYDYSYLFFFFSCFFSPFCALF